ncbi:MAG: hypothetical protein QNI84_00470 [Henriciella sp.]|nr:hypothetical protein [Henriciella sp.]
MFRLYKRDENGRAVAYHEAWAEPERRRIVEHWGLVGEAGDTLVHRIWFFGSLEKQFNSILDPARALGFAEIETDEYQLLIVEYAVEGFGSKEDLDKRYSLEDRLNEILGWTGLGFCDGGESGSDIMNAACFVVDFEQAKAVIEETLEGSEFADYARMYQE